MAGRRATASFAAVPTKLTADAVQPREEQGPDEVRRSRPQTPAAGLRDRIAVEARKRGSTAVRGERPQALAAGLRDTAAVEPREAALPEVPPEESASLLPARADLEAEVASRGAPAGALEEVVDADLEEVEAAVAPPTVDTPAFELEPAIDEPLGAHAEEAEPALRFAPSRASAAAFADEPVHTFERGPKVRNLRPVLWIGALAAGLAVAVGLGSGQFLEGDD